MAANSGVLPLTIAVLICVMTLDIRRRSPNPTVQAETCLYNVAVPDAEPNHILEKIVWHKEQEVDRFRLGRSLHDLRRDVETLAPPLDFVGALRQGKTQPALIAEVKKASPSKGVICENFDPEAIATAYVNGGASCISVLTDSEFFQGGFDILSRVRQVVDIPLLCKDFIIYPYQIYKARAHGADAILLIAAILNDRDITYFLKIAKVLGMAALVEVHSLAELDRVLAIDGVELVGINNRNLENFNVDLAVTEQLSSERRQELIAKNILLVSESGLHQSADVQRVAQAGAAAILVGESLVKQADPQAGIQALLGRSVSQ